MTLPWIIGCAALGVLAGPWIRFRVFASGTESGQPPRLACPACAHQIVPSSRPASGPASRPVRWWRADWWRADWWRAVLPVTGRCPACRSRIGPYPLLPEFAAGLALAIAAYRASSVWELAALAWLVLLSVPLAFIDIAVRRLPNPLTAAAGAGVFVLLAAAAFAGHQLGSLARAVLGAVLLACFYLVLWLIRPGGMGLGDVKLAVSIGLVLAWIGWQGLFAGTFLAFILAACYGVALLVTRKAGRGSQLPMGPFMLAGALAAIAFLPVGSLLGLLGLFGLLGPRRATSPT